MTNKNGKTRVLVVNTSGIAISNGIATNMYNYLSHIVGEDIEVDVAMCASKDELTMERFRSIGCRIIDMPHRRMKYREYLKALWQLCRDGGYDAVHFHTNSHTITPDLIAAWCGNRRVVCTIAADPTTCDHVVVHRLFAPLFHMFCQVRLACGEAAGRWMYGNHRFTVINNSIDTERFMFRIDVRQRLRQELGWKDCRIIGHVGAFNLVKNQTFVVEVFRKMILHDNKCRLILMGDGSWREKIEQLVRDYGLNDVVRFTGAVTNIHEYLSALDIVLMPSLYEGLPLTLIEQQANGLRIVLSDVITHEADKTGNLIYLPLKASISVWAETALSIKPDNDEKRNVRSCRAVNYITQAGYSIQTEAEKLKQIYLSTRR